KSPSTIFGLRPPGSKRGRGATRQSRSLSTEWWRHFGSRVIEIAAWNFASAWPKSHGMGIAFRFDNHPVTRQAIMSPTTLARLEALQRSRALVSTREQFT